MLIDLSYVTKDIIFSYLIIFCRIGSSLMVSPGISENFIAVKIRLIFGLFMTILIAPHISMINTPENVLFLSLVIIKEVLVGIFLGLITRFLVGVTHILGIIIATISGLGSALLFDPTQGSQGAIVGSFLGNLTLVLLFATDMHHMLLYGFAKSYTLFSVNSKIDISFMSYEIIKLTSTSFDIALKLAAPQIIIAVMIMIAGGILGRLMPSIQIFNLITPAQMLISFLIIILTISDSINWYMKTIYDISKSYLLP